MPIELFFYLFFQFYFNFFINFLERDYTFWCVLKKRLLMRTYIYIFRHTRILADASTQTLDRVEDLQKQPMEFSANSVLHLLGSLN